MRLPLAASIIGMTSLVYFIGLAVWIATLSVGRDNVQDIARSLSVSIAQQLKVSMLADLTNAETVTRTNARIFLARIGMDSDDGQQDRESGDENEHVDMLREIHDRRVESPA